MYISKNLIKQREKLTRLESFTTDKTNKLRTELVEWFHIEHPSIIKEAIRLNNNNDNEEHIFITLYNICKHFSFNLKEMKQSKGVQQ